jgi:hypothetical protein
MPNRKTHRTVKLGWQEALGPVDATSDRCDGDRMGTAQGTNDVVYWTYTRSERRGAVPIRPRPFGLCPKGCPPALRTLAMEPPCPAVRALAGALLGDNAAIRSSVNRP